MTFPYYHFGYNSGSTFYDMVSFDHSNLNTIRTLQTSVIVLLMLFCYLSVTAIIDRYQHPSVNPNKPGDPSYQRPFFTISPVSNSVPGQNDQTRKEKNEYIWMNYQMLRNKNIHSMNLKHIQLLSSCSVSRRYIN